MGAFHYIPSLTGEFGHGLPEILVNLCWFQWDYAHPSVSSVLAEESVLLGMQ